jgi:hypothetical protein
MMGLNPGWGCTKGSAPMLTEQSSPCERETVGK